MKPGDRVICIDDSIPFPDVFRDFKSWPELNRIYTVRALQNSIDRGQGIQLEELPNAKIFIADLGGYVEPAYSIRRFRLLQPDEVLEAEQVNEAVLV